MDNGLGDLIKYYGIESYEKSNLQDFNQFSTSSIFYIPEINNIEISKIWTEIKNISSQIYYTPKGVSYEGQVLCGNKLVICGDLKVKIEYIFSEQEKLVKSVDLDIPISTSVTLDVDFDECLTTYPSIVIEDVFCRKLNNNKFYFSAMMIAIVDTF